MKVLSKEYILSLISEQQSHMDDLDEMSRVMRTDWTNNELSEPLSWDVPGVSSKNPQTGEVEQDKVYSTKERIAPGEEKQKLYMFTDMTDGKPKMYEPGINKVHKQIPRNWKYGTAYNPESIEKKVDARITRLQKVQSTSDHRHDDENLRGDVKNRLIKENNDMWAKRYVIHPMIGAMMNQPDIKQHLDLCGIPNVTVGAAFTEPITNIQPQFDFNGPSMHFAYHTTRDASDVQDYIDKILNVHTGDEFDYGKGNKMVRRHGGNVYPGGLWTPEQRAWSKQKFKETPVLKLPMKNVQKGEMGFNVVSDLVVMGKKASETTYVLQLNLRFEVSRRGANTEHVKSDELLTPIKITVKHDIEEGNDCTVRNNKDFFVGLFQEGLQKMGEQILQIDYDDVLTALAFEPDDVIADQPAQPNR